VRSSFVGSTHTVKIVLTNVEHWKLPESSHVGSFIQLALVCSTISIHSNSYIRLFLVLKSESETSSDRELSTNDTITSIEVVL
jgi:hypothetical protein